MSEIDTKFCIQCGRKIPINAVFCPNCGAKQNSINQKENTNTEEDSAETVLEDEINVNAEAPTESIGISRDSIPNAVNSYRHKMGFTDDVPFVSGYFQSMKIAAFSPLASALKTKTFILTMEKDGLLVMKIGLTNHFTGENTFIPYKHITSLSIKNHGMIYRLKLLAQEGKLVASISKVIIAHPWQKINAKKFYEDLPLKINK